MHEAAAEARSRGAPRRATTCSTSSRRSSRRTRGIHEQGVLHGDVHPRNVLVDPSGRVTVIDFGLAARRRPAISASHPRGGIDFFMEPELAACVLAREPPPPADARGEQYSIARARLPPPHGRAHAALLARGARDAAPARPRPAAGLRGARRHRSRPDRAGRAARAREGSGRPLREPWRSSAPPIAVPLSSSSLSRRVRRRRPRPDRRTPSWPRCCDGSALGGELLDARLEAPTASLQNGAAGFAYALLRIAGVREDEELLALADVWSQRALQAIELPTRVHERGARDHAGDVRHALALPLRDGRALGRRAGRAGALGRSRGARVDRRVRSLRA